MRKLFKLFTSRLFWSVLAFILQFAVIAYFVFWASYVKGYFIVLYIFSIIMSFVVFTRPEKPAYRTVWIFLICIFPIYGAVLYFLMANKKLGYFSRKKTEAFRRSLPREDSIPQNADEELYALSPEFRKLSLFVKNSTGMDAWLDTECTYFEYADAFFIDLLEEVRKAQRFIFIEYFIIGKGHWWSLILSELEKKVKEGVDVRVIYDDMGSISALPKHYDRELREKGLKAVAFNPVRFHFNPRLNFRDHRKIFDIDGNICYTGGLNLSDEYSNDVIRFGYWKDNAVKIKGSAVMNFTFLFLEMWMGVAGGKDNLAYYLPTEKGRSDGFVQPFGDNPLDADTTTENVYLKMISMAERNIWITTPYLVPDDSMIEALSIAARSGVDVRIITPHYPDKKTVFEVSRSNYLQLLESGVRIYEYIPGFIHSKTFLVDDDVAVVGTTNIDFRSFYLHFELSVLFFRSSIVDAVKKDFLKTFEMSKEQTISDAKDVGLIKRIARYFLRLFSPAL